MLVNHLYVFCSHLDLISVCECFRTLTTRSHLNIHPRCAASAIRMLSLFDVVLCASLGWTLTLIRNVMCLAEDRAPQPACTPRPLPSLPSRISTNHPRSISQILKNYHLGSLETPRERKGMRSASGPRRGGWKRKEKVNRLFHI